MPKSAPRAIARGVNSAISCEAGTKGSNFSGLVSAIATSKPEARVLATVGPAAMLRRTPGRRNRRLAAAAAAAVAVAVAAVDAVEVRCVGVAHLDSAAGEVLAPAPRDQRRRAGIGAQLAREAGLQPCVDQHRRLVGEVVARQRGRRGMDVRRRLEAGEGGSEGGDS